MTKKSKTTIEQTIAKQRAEIAKRLHIMQAWNRSYHVLEIPGDDGEPIKAWPGPFHSKRAAELVLEDVIDHYVEGNLDAFEGLDLVGNYEREAGFVEIIEKHGGVNDPRKLALLLFQKQPWDSRAGDRDAEIPF